MNIMDKYENRRLRLIQLRDELCNGNASELARKIEREPSYVSRMLWTEDKAGRKRIADNMIEVIEKAFKLPRGWMDGISQEPVNINMPYQSVSYTSYPVISSEMAASWPDDADTSGVNEWLPSEAEIKGKAFWMRVEGDSMVSPAGLSIPEGTYVLFDTGIKPTNGSLIAVTMGKNRGAIFKKLVIDGGTSFLKGLNPQWPVAKIEDSSRIIGVAIETKLYLLG